LLSPIKLNYFSYLVIGCKKTSFESLSFMALFDNPLSKEAEEADLFVG